MAARKVCPETEFLSGAPEGDGSVTAAWLPPQEQAGFARKTGLKRCVFPENPRGFPGKSLFSAEKHCFPVRLGRTSE